MNPSVPKQLIAVSNDGKHVMGYYAMFTVPDRFVSASKLSRAWASEALPMELVPSNRRAVDTFKRACRSVETRRSGGNRVVEVKVDQVDETPSECVYQVTHMVRDSAQRQIDHPKAMKVTFNKNSETITYDPLSKRYASTLDAIEAAIQDFFDANSAKVPGHKVRSAVRGLMSASMGVNVRRKAGGIYFLPKDAKDNLDSLTRVLDHLYGDDAEVHLIPCADDEYQKDMVAKHFEMNVSSEIDETIARVADKLTSSRRMRHDAVANLFARRAELGKMRSDYAELIGGELEVVTEKLGLLDAQLEALIERNHGEGGGDAA